MFSADELLGFWFCGLFEHGTEFTEKRAVWVGSRKDYHGTIRRRMISYTTLASEGVLDQWQMFFKGRLALILLLDRISRVCYRGSALAHQNDSLALKLSRDTCRQFSFNEEPVLDKVFVLFPQLVSERNADVMRSLDLLQGFTNCPSEDQSAFVSDLISLGQRNLRVLEKFSRYPHRARLQGKPLSPEEQGFVREYTWQDWM